MLDLMALVAIIAALISIGGAVFTALFHRRGSDADVKTDLAELALLVDRMAKAQRREKMARVRATTRDKPQEAEQIPLDYPQDIKTAIRHKIAQMKRG